MAVDEPRAHYRTTPNRMSTVVDLSRAADKRPDLGLLGALAFETYAHGLRDYLARHGHGGLRPADTELIRLLHVMGSLPITRIAELREVTKQAASRHAAEFVKRGYGETTHASSDRRERHVQLTASGRQVRQLAISYGDEVAARLITELGAATMQSTVGVFEWLINSADTRSTRMQTALRLLGEQ